MRTKKQEFNEHARFKIALDKLVNGNDMFIELGVTLKEIKTPNVLNLFISVTTEGSWIHLNFAAV